MSQRAHSNQFVTNKSHLNIIPQTVRRSIHFHPNRWLLWYTVCLFGNWFWESVVNKFIGSLVWIFCILRKRPVRVHVFRLSLIWHSTASPVSLEKTRCFFLKLHSDEQPGLLNALCCGGPHFCGKTGTTSFFVGWKEFYPEYKCPCVQYQPYTGNKCAKIHLRPYKL